MHASAAERQNWQLLGDGYTIEWTDLDEHIGIEEANDSVWSAESKVICGQ